MLGRFLRFLFANETFAITLCVIIILFEAVARILAHYGVIHWRFQ